ncbi:MAG: hypothetical protein QM613_00045 [Micrococcaceae bacterium]
MDSNERINAEINEIEDTWSKGVPKGYSGSRISGGQKSKVVSFKINGQELEMLEAFMKEKGYKAGRAAKELVIDKLFEKKYRDENEIERQVVKYLRKYR